MEHCKECCGHRIIRKHKDDFLKAVKAVDDAIVRDHKDNKAIRNINCLGDISVTWSYHRPEVTTPRGGVF